MLANAVGQAAQRLRSELGTRLLSIGDKLVDLQTAKAGEGPPADVFRERHRAESDRFGFEPPSHRFQEVGFDAGESNQPVVVRAFLDRSILEVYCGGAALTGRTFPSPEALGMDVFAEGGVARLTSLEIWHMQSIWRPSP